METWINTYITWFDFNNRELKRRIEGMRPTRTGWRVQSKRVQKNIPRRTEPWASTILRMNNKKNDKINNNCVKISAISDINKFVHL